MDYDRRSLREDLERLIAVWPELPRRTREGILMLAGLRKLPNVKNLASSWRRSRGDTPDWMVSALNLLKDSKGYMTDREIARRLGVANSTLVRSPAYQHARKTYLQEIKKIVRKKTGKKSSRE